MIDDSGERSLPGNRRLTYGLGSAASSSKAVTRGDATGTLTMYGLRSPMGLWERPRARSAKLSGGAKSAALKRAKLSSRSLDGAGSVDSAAGGAIGRREPPMADAARTRPYACAEIDDPGRGP